VRYGILILVLLLPVTAGLASMKDPLEQGPPAPSAGCSVHVEPAPEEPDLAPVLSSAREAFVARGWTIAEGARYRVAARIGYVGPKTTLALSLRSTATGEVVASESTGASVYAMPDVVPTLTRRLLERLATHQAEADWKAGRRPPRQAPPADVPMGEGGEVSLLPFEYDPTLVEAWRYDGCVRDGVCPKREVTPPPACGDAPAVGMAWEAAESFCRALGWRVQSAFQDAVIREELGDEAWQGGRELVEGDPMKRVKAGFRCTKAVEH